MDNSADQSQMCSNVVFGLALFLLSGFLPGLRCETCSYEAAIIAAQQTCKHSNEAIIKAKDDDNNTLVCSQFFLFLKCVAANSSQCFDQVYTIMHSYFDSPYHCEQTQELILELQKLQQNALTSPTTHEATGMSSQPTTVDNTEITESKLITTTRTSSDHGSKGEHKGPHNSSTTITNFGMHSLLLVISSVLPWLQLSCLGNKVPLPS